MCPKCGKPVSHVKTHDVDVHVGSKPEWNGIAYCCPSCGVILSVQIDPIALKNDTILALKKP